MEAEEATVGGVLFWRDENDTDEQFRVEPHLRDEFCEFMNSCGVKIDEDFDKQIAGLEIIPLTEPTTPLPEELEGTVEDKIETALSAWRRSRG